MRVVLLRKPSPWHTIRYLLGLSFSLVLLAAAISPSPWASLRQWSTQALVVFSPTHWLHLARSLREIPLQATELPYIEGAQEGTWVSAQTAILIDNETGTVLYAKNEHRRYAPASTTKIMTAILALEQGRLDQTVTISRRAASVIGSQVYLQAGQKVKLRDLLAAMLISSGNDAATAIAEEVGGSVEHFVEMMNRRASELGVSNTHFVNPHGLDSPDHYSTAYDLALLARVALHYPTFAQIVSTRVYTPESIPGATWHNTNRLLWSFDGMQGVKTGTTSRAGQCLVAAASRGGRQLITVVIDSANRWADTSRLLEYGFTQFELLRPVRRGQAVATVHVRGGVQPDQTVSLVATRDLVHVVRRGQSAQYQIRMDLLPLHAPVRRGHPAGTLTLLHDGKAEVQVSLETAQAVPGPTPWQRLRRWLSR